ncbi:MAG: hypothetical protein PHS17_19930 [Desulfobacterales bacterium]|nr:hypothetical protein [Desulfobacterales bacterium]
MAGTYHQEKESTMPDNQELEALGYRPVYRSNKFEIWYREESQRVYVNLLHPVTAEDVALAVKKTQPLDLPLMDLITDHSLMPRTDLVQDEDLSVCLDEFFDRFNVRNVVRICNARMNCDICVPLDTRLSGEEKGKIQGRVNTFTDANRLLDHQHGVP